MDLLPIIGIGSIFLRSNNLIKYKSMEKIKTTEITVGSGKIRKELGPGNHTVRINSITFDKTPFNDESWNINLHVEGEPLGDDFEGFFKDKDDESKGRYLGQTGRVRGSAFTFKDGMAGTVRVTRDSEVLRWLKNFTDNTGLKTWFENQSDKHNTIEDLMTQMEKDQPFKDQWYETCIGGKTYSQVGKNDGKVYEKYDLNLTPFTAKSSPIKPKGSKDVNLTSYNQDVHIYYKGKPKKTGAKPTEFEL